MWPHHKFEECTMVKKILVQYVVGPPRANGRGVFVDCLSFCICFYNISSLSRLAYGAFLTSLLCIFLPFLIIVPVD